MNNGTETGKYEDSSAVWMEGKVCKGMQQEGKKGGRLGPEEWAPEIPPSESVQYTSILCFGRIISY